MLSVEEKKNIVAKFGANENDTGSPEVQIALLTSRILYLTDHLRSHKKDWVASVVTCWHICRNTTWNAIALSSKN